MAFDYSILQQVLKLKDIPELHDRIIAATAKRLDIPVMTKDKILHSVPYIKAIW